MICQTVQLEQCPQKKGKRKLVDDSRPGRRPSGRLANVAMTFPYSIGRITASAPWWGTFAWHRVGKGLLSQGLLIAARAIVSSNFQTHSSPTECPANDSHD